MTTIPVTKFAWSPAELEPAPTETCKLKPMSSSAKITFGKSYLKEYRELNRTRPDLRLPRRKRAWRVIRKWFNRYQRPRLIGMTMIVDSVLGSRSVFTIKDVKIRKGRPGVTFDYTLTPQK